MTTTNLNYRQTKDLIQKNFSDFPIKWAFNGTQLNEALKALEVESTKDLFRVTGGGFIRKSDGEAFKKMLDDNDKILTDFLNSNYENIFDAMVYELQNHEYSYTGEITSALDALRLEYSTLTELQLKALNEAKKMKYHD